jgi:hypothetical protein
VLGALPLIYVEALLCLPEILEEDDEDTDARLFPESYPGDGEKEAEWSRLTRPELRALFASRTEIIVQDLRRLRVEKGAESFSLVIPAAHITAWMAGLNAARLMLGVHHGIEDSDMELDPDFLDPQDKDIALLKIHLLGHIEGLIVDAED